MLIGVPMEVKNNENRVALTPAGAHTLAKLGHKVLVQASAGLGSGLTDARYKEAGAVIVDSPQEVFAVSDIIVKVKEPVASEYPLLKEGQILFTYLHLAANKPLVSVLLDKKITAIAYETVQLQDGSLPLLAPMSEVAGRMSVQVGAAMLQKNNGGMGVLLGGVPGVAPGEVLIIGGGTVGTNAAKMAVGLGAHVTVMDISKSRLIYLDDLFSGRVATVVYSEYLAAEYVKKADLLIGAVLVAGAKAPKTVSTEMVKSMKPGSVIVDVAIDQGGSIETIDHVTTHDQPCYERFGVIHYSVANMPGAVPKTSTYALTSVTLPYLSKLAEFDDIIAGLKKDTAFFKGLNTYKGQITHKAVADSMGMDYTNL